jgi:membrane-associated phospholipid phosphatase
VKLEATALPRSDERPETRPLRLREALAPDLVLLGIFGVALTATMVHFRAVPSFLHGSTVLSLIAMTVLLAIGRKAAAQTLKLWAPLVLVLFVYSNFHDITRLIHPMTVDHWLRDADLALFGGEPTLWLQSITVPWLTELMTFAYALFFVFPLIVLVRLHVRGDQLGFREVTLAFTLCFYLGLVGYLTVPAIGPRFTVVYDVPLTGYVLTDAAAAAWNTIEKVETDCFPSLHTAVSTISLVYLWRLRGLPRGRLLLGVCAPFIVMLWASTLYLRYHYTVDVLAGFGLAAVCVGLAPALMRIFYGRAGIHGPTDLTLH